MKSQRIHIIGQGLAGSVLAYRLLQRGCDVRIYDQGHQDSSSIVAAGMWNPISFRKLHRSWSADVLVPAAEELYREMEKVLQSSFFHEIPLTRIFNDHGAANEWDERSGHPEVASFLSSGSSVLLERQFNTEHGYGWIHKAGWMNIPLFLGLMRAWFADNGVFEEKSISPDFEIHSNELVIWCTGWRGNSHTEWSWLPITPNKGEVLTISSQMDLDVMTNFGQFVIPLGEAKFRLGATYAIGQPSLEPTESARGTLMKGWNKFCKVEAHVLDQQVGFRPTVPDRKPLLGRHPERPDHAVFNGFGSKGVMLIPYFSSIMVSHLLDAIELPREVNAHRYWKGK